MHSFGIICMNGPTVATVTLVVMFRVFTAVPQFETLSHCPLATVLSYNMIGHSKFCITLVGGFIIFNDPLTANQLAGILLAVAGITVYTILKVRGMNAQLKKTVPPKQSV